mmetsp:Transcript_58868/g.140430  ORF Transcript_58868/g.140430 Transcript_58868/m.140430 type:complete len:279 (+) Transcript_58868:417-1253(+)
MSESSAAVFDCSTACLSLRAALAGGDGAELLLWDGDSTRSSSSGTRGKAPAAMSASLCRSFSRWRTCSAFSIYLLMSASSCSACSTVFSICFSMAAKLVRVCCSHCLICSSVANLFSPRIFSFVCISGSLTPASFIADAVPGLEPAVLGRPAVDGLDPPARSVPASATFACVSRKVVSTSSVASSCMAFTSCGCGTGASFKYSKASNFANTFCASSMRLSSAARGLPCMSNSRKVGISFSISKSSGLSKEFRDTSKISKVLSRCATVAGRVCKQFPAK